MSVLARILRHTFRFPLQRMLSLVMAVLCTTLVLVLPGVTMRFIDVIIGQKPPDLIGSTAAIGVAAILARQVLFTLRTYVNNALEQKLTHLVRIELYDKLQRLPVKWFDSNSSGEIMSRVADGVPTMDRVMIEGVDQALAALLQFLIVVGYMLYHSWQLTLVTLLPLPFIGLLTSWWARRSEPMWRASSEASSALNAILNDHLAGIRQIKAYTVEPKALETFGKASRKVGEKHMRVMRGQAVVWPAVSFIAESGIILMVAFGAYWALSGKLSPGTVISFIVAWGFLFDPISRINPLSQTFTRGIVAAKPQESFLFNTTLRENLLLAKHDATDDELWAALEAANAAAFVRAHPEGLDTLAGERGGRFSDGEKQRLSIARALLKNPPLLLLDEATSALDNRTERLVQQAFENLRADRTCFVIAHRLSTVKQADHICVLDGGRLVEQGTHAELAARGVAYAKLCEAGFAIDPRPGA